LLVACATSRNAATPDDTDDEIGIGAEQRRVLEARVHVGAMALRGSRLYFTSAGREGDEIWVMPAAGGDIPKLVLAGHTLEAAPVFDDDFVYFVAAGGTLHRAPLRGQGLLETLATPAAGPGAAPEPESLDSFHGFAFDVRTLPEAMALDGSSVYWLAPARRTVWRAPKHGGQAAPVAELGAAVAAKLALGADHVYVGTSGDGGAHLLRRAKTGAGGLETLAKVDDARLFAIAGSRVVWVASDTLFGLPPLGATPPKISAPAGKDYDFPSVWVVAATEGAVYFSSWDSGRGDGAVSRQPLDGGPSRVLAAHLYGAPGLLAIHGDSVYFATLGHKAHPKMRKSVSGCCSIWAMPR
jgi:hypothetical protein